MAKEKKALLIGVVLIAAAIGLYFLVKKPEPEPPPTEVSARIDGFTITAV